MKIYDGNLYDSTAFDTDKFLKINSCGSCKYETETITQRKKGRPDYHLVYLCKGECNVVYNNQNYKLNEGSLFIYDPFVPHLYQCTENSLTFWIHFAGKVIPELFNTMNIVPGVYQKKFSSRVSEQFRHLINQYKLPKYENELYGSLFTLLAFIAEEMHEENDVESTEPIWKIASYINDNFSKKLTLDELSKLSGYSKSRFSHLFFKVTGISPLAYQRNIQLENAREMLTYSHMTIKEIATACGFDDQLYFSKVFKNKFGFSPSEFRNKNNNQM